MAVSKRSYINFANVTCQFLQINLLSAHIANKEELRRMGEVEKLRKENKYHEVHLRKCISCIKKKIGKHRGCRKWKI